MNVAYRGMWLCVIFLICSTPGCKKNIEENRATALVPITYSFNAPYNKSWNAVVESVSGFNSIDFMDKNSGIISTDVNVIDGKDFTIIESVINDQTYIFNYTINLRANGSEETNVTIRVKFFKEMGSGIYHQEQKDPAAESFFREQLYSQICQTLFPLANSECSHDFNGPSSIVTSLSTAKLQQKLHYDKRVFIAQQKLNVNGHNAGVADGLLGKNTRKALKSFQRNNGLPVTGALDMTTYELLMEQVSNTSQGEEQLQKEKSKTTSIAPTQVILPRQIERRKKVAEPVQQVARREIQSELVENGEPRPPVEETAVILPGNTIGETPSLVLQGETVEAEQTSKEPEVSLLVLQPQVGVAEKYVATETAYLLEDQDLLSAKILDIIPEGTSIAILSATGDYYKVLFNGVEGYIHVDFVVKQN